jgi:phosphatidylglycerophosphatase A
LLPRAPASAATAVGALVIGVLRPTVLAHGALLASAVALGQSMSPALSSAEEADPQRIVIDELAGVWMALLGIPLTAGRCVAGAVLFRVLDKLKPGPIGFVDRLEGRWSIMGDDLVAGVVANLALRAWIGGVATLA